MIFSYVWGEITAVAIARSNAYGSPRPQDLGEKLWENAGNRIDAEYHLLASPLPVRKIVADLQPLLPERHSPLNHKGTGNQGYLFGLPPRAGQFLLDRIEETEPGVDAETVARAVRNSTERRALVMSRLGQGQFRDNLMEFWGGRCAITGLDLSLLLRASHIKPWRDSDNRERLDPYNGFLLSPVYDAVFDAGLITIDDYGRIVTSVELTPSRVERLGLNTKARIVGLHDNHLDYLNHHRRNVFVTGVRL